MRRFAVTLAAAAVALGAPAAALTLLPGAPATAFAQEAVTSLPDIEDEVMCPICGVTLELATEAPQAIEERAFIRERIEQGMTKDEIKDDLVAEFGPEVLAIPETEGFDLAAWLVPGLAIVIAGVAIVFALRRWKREGGDIDGDGFAEPPAEAISEEDSKRLDADLARYE